VPPHDDHRIQYARAVGARLRLEVALAQLQAARAEVSIVLGENHPSVPHGDEACLSTRKMAALLDLAIRRLP